MDMDSLVISYLERNLGYCHEDAESAWNALQNDPRSQGYVALLKTVAAMQNDN